MYGIATRLFRNTNHVRQILHNFQRSGHYLCKKLTFSKYGNPLDVVSLEEEEIKDDLQSNEVIVKMVASPIHPSDINYIEGKYAITVDSFPSLIGNEGLAEVVSTGSHVKNMQPGDYVIPFYNQSGTWRSHARLKETQLIKIRQDVPLMEGATMAVNPCTAYRLLLDFENLDPGDVIIQNAANSAVGQAVIQICKRRKITSVNIVRDRANLPELVEYLTRLGADIVLTEQQLRTTKIFKSGQVQWPRLALNAVCGASATELMRHIEDGTSLVTYGAMSRQPITVAPGKLIFRGITLHGFWLTDWNQMNIEAHARWEMLDQIQSMCVNGRLVAPRHTCVLIDNYREALRKASDPDGKCDRKQILVFDTSLVTKD